MRIGYVATGAGLPLLACGAFMAYLILYSILFMGEGVPPFIVVSTISFISLAAVLFILDRIVNLDGIVERWKLFEASIALLFMACVGIPMIEAYVANGGGTFWAALGIFAIALTGGISVLYIKREESKGEESQTNAPAAT